MRCARCQSDNPSRNAFCGKCGASLVHLCPHCEAENPPDNAFCGQCGGVLTDEEPDETTDSAAPTLANQFQALSDAQPSVVHDATLTHHTGENRFVTVLFADMTSSVETTHGLRADEAAELINGLLAAMVESLKRYDGRIDRFLGDGVLAVFGTPHAHENDPERAIRAAIEIRDAAEGLDLGVTAGINSGEVFFGEMGSREHSELTVMGPVVNLAARLQGCAAAGQILIGDATHRHTRRMFRFTDLSVEIKGIDRPVVAHRVEEALPRPERVRGIEGLRAELIGRDREFADLKQTLARALGGDGQIVTVIGEAGVGKSRLTAELQQFAMTPTEDRPVPLWLEGRCVELGVAASYWPFIDAFHAYFAWHTADDDSVRGAAIVDALQALVRDGSLTEEQMEQMGPLLGHLLAVQFGSDWDDRLKFADGQQVRHQTFNAVRDFLVALSHRQPLVLVLDDLHWADSLSIDLISLLMETLADAPIFLLCVYRPERDHRCWRLGSVAERKCPERYHTMTLRELTPDESRALVEALLTIEDLPESVKEMILEKAHGNPFFVEEVVRSLIDSEAVYHDGDVWTAAEGIESVTVPETVQGIVLSRVDRLEDELRHVLQSASVIGRVFRRRVLERVATQSSDIEQALWELEDRALIYQGRTVPEPEYVFRHALTQDAVYQTVVQRRRTEFHGTVAREMEALYADDIDEHVEQLAYHYELSTDDDRAVEYLIRAGEKARRNHVNEPAIELFRRALSRSTECVVEGSSLRCQLDAYLGLGRSYLAWGDAVAAEDPLRRAVEAGRRLQLPARERVRVCYWLCECLWWRSGHDENRQLGQECLGLLGDDTECIEAVLATQVVAAADFAGGDGSVWRENTGRTAPLLLQLPYCEELRAPYFHVFLVHHHAGDIDEAERWASRLEASAERAHDVRGLIDAHMGRAYIATASGAIGEAISANRALLAAGESIGDPTKRSAGARYVAQLCLAQGRLDDAEAHILEAQEASLAVGQTLEIAHCCATAGLVFLCRHAYGPAAEAFEEAARVYSEGGVEHPGSPMCLGWTHLAEGDPPRALSCFRDAISLLGSEHSSLRVGTFSGPLLRVLAGVERILDDPQEFQRLCRRTIADHPDCESTIGQWHLRPGTPDGRTDHVVVPFDGPCAGGWGWCDPFQDCAYQVDGDLCIHASNGRGLRGLNVGAPRIVRPVAGDFSLRAVCRPARRDRPGIGGLLAWQDKGNYLRLDIGVLGEYGISCSGRIGAEDVEVGRGRLVAERTHLRLERVGTRVRSFCSADGEAWSTAGETEFPVDGPIEVGMHAIGNIDRLIYPGAFPHGTAIRFDEFQLWQ